MKNVVKNKWYFNYKIKEKFFITEIIDYEGSKEMCINYITGFGASEKRNKLILPYKEYEDFLNNLTINKKQNKMENSNPQDEKNNFSELRNVLFETLRGVKDGSIDAKKAKSISDISQTLINTAKVEIDYIKVTGNKNKSKMISE